MSVGNVKAARTRRACSKHGLHVNSQLHAAVSPHTTPVVRTALTLQNLSSELYLAVAFLLLHHRSDCRRCFAQIAGESTRLAEPRGPHRGLARHRCSPHRTLQSDGGWSRGGSCGGARTPSGSFSPRPGPTEGSQWTR